MKSTSVELERDVAGGGVQLLHHSGQHSYLAGLLPRSIVTMGRAGGGSFRRGELEVPGGGGLGAALIHSPRCGAECVGGAAPGL